MFRLSFNTNGLLDMSLERAIEEVAKAGYDGIEISLDANHLHPYDVTRERLHALKEQMDRLQLAPVSLATGGLFLLSDVPQEPSLISGDAEGRQRRIDFICASLEIANYLSIPVLNFTSGILHRDFEHDNVPAEEAKKMLVEGIQACLPSAGDVILVLEPEATLHSHFIETTSQAIPIIEEVNSPQFRLTIDIAHVKSFESDLLRCTADALPYAKHIQIADTKGRVHHHDVPGDGDIDFPALFEVLRTGGYEHYLSLELYWHPYDWERALYQSRRHLLEQMQVAG